MEEMPVYELEPQTPFQQEMANLGFSAWYRVPSAQPNAFYTLIATGILFHYYQDYPISEYLRKHYSAELPTLMTANQDNQHPERWRDLLFWSQIGPALISDCNRKFQSKPAGSIVRSGRMPDKDASSLFESLMTACAGLLVWYELEDGQVVSQVRSAPGRSAAVYLCGGEENGWYYLLIHSTFQQGGSREGFPFFTTNSSSREGLPEPRTLQEMAVEPPVQPEEPLNPSGVLDFIRAINERMGTIERKCDTLASRLESLEKAVREKLDDILGRLTSPHQTL